MEQQINVADELARLEGQIGWIIVGSAQGEAEEVKKEIKKLVQRVEETLVRQAGLPRGYVNKEIDNLEQNLNYRLGHNLSGIREKEYNETKANFGTVEKPDLQDTSEQLARFQYDGIVSKNNEYSVTVEQICDEVIGAYRKMLGNMGTRGADEAYSDIRNAIRRTSNNIQEIHDEYTRRIKQGISNKVEELGLKVTATLQAQIEQTVESKSEENLSDFERAMHSQTKSTDEVTRDDAKEISENEAAFRGNVETRTTTRKDLEDMFK